MITTYRHSFSKAAPRRTKKSILYIILLLPFLETILFKEKGYEAIDRIFWMTKIVTLLVTGFLLLFERKKISKAVWAVFLQAIVMFTATLLNQDADLMDFRKCANFAGGALACSFLAEYFLPILREKLLAITRDILFIMIVANIYMMIAYPLYFGSPTTFLLGLDNRFFHFTMPLVFTSVAYSITVKGKYDLWVYASIIASLYMTISTWAVGGFLGMIVIAVGILVFTRFRWFNKINSWTFFLIPQVTSVIVSVMRVHYIFYDFITETLKKDITLSGRTLLWDKVLEIFSRNPIIGIGVLNDVKTISMLRGLAHAHNEILDYLFRTGILGIAAYFFFWFAIVSKINRIKDHRIRGLCNTFMFVHLFMGIADTVLGILFYLVYICMYHYSGIFERRK